MENLPEWFQDFILNLSGDVIFWLPIVLVGLGLLFLWTVPALGKTVSNIIGWVLFILMAGSAATTWFHIWDWRADEYQQEASEELSGMVLVGDDISDSNISADPYGVVSVELDLDYEFGFAETFMISDVEDIIDYMVINYKLSEEDGNSDSYIHQIRSFQEFHVHVYAEDSIDDILSYHPDTLRSYAQESSLIDPDAESFWSDEEEDQVAAEEEISETIDETGYRVSRTGYSPWHILDEQASDGGVTVGQWGILTQAPEALESLNMFTCSVFNAEQCSEDEAETYHSIGMAFAVIGVGIFGVIIFELILRGIRNRKRKNAADNSYDPHHAETTK